MMPEAIAIVCAPSKKPDLGIFRLINPSGLDVISKCSSTGFHAHMQKDFEIYEDIKVGFFESETKVVDLRA